MLPSPDSTGAQNHDRKPNGIPLDSVRPENALEATLLINGASKSGKGLVDKEKALITAIRKLKPPA